MMCRRQGAAARPRVCPPPLPHHTYLHVAGLNEIKSILGSAAGAEWSKTSDSGPETAQVQILTVTVPMFISIIDFLLYRLPPLFCLITPPQSPVAQKDGLIKT
ncbi:hypothetical protein J6590_080628 [Homalodisca vitripennis]|nr:hypothetical protein J6590_080628 [Homalodisca vitripennis]